MWRGGLNKYQGIAVGYNVPIAVDNKYQLMVDPEGTHEVTEQDQLATMAQRAKDTLAAGKREAVADMGYDHGDAVNKCLEDGMVPYIPKPTTAAHSTLGLCGKEDCLYDVTKDG
jgi:hypothetical protein